MANKTIKGLTVEIGGDSTKLSKAIDDADKHSRSLSSELTQINKLLKFDDANPELLAQKQQVLTDQIAATSEKLSNLRALQQQAQDALARGEAVSEEHMRALQREIISTEGRLGGYEKQAEETAAQLIHLGDAQNGAGDGADTLGDQADELSDDMEALDEDTENAADSAEKAGAGFSAAAVAVGTFIGGLALDALEGAVGLLKDMTGAMIEQVGAAAEYGDNIDKMSQKLGLSAEAYQEWDFIMQHAGSDIDRMTAAAKKLADAVAEPTAASAAAFEKLGISMERAANMSQEELFAETVTALQGMESGAERTALANDLLGKSAMDLGALLNMSADETEAMRQQVHDLGGVMSEDAVKASAAYQDSLQNLQTAVSGAARGFASELLPSVTDVTDGLTLLLSGDDSGIGLLTAGIEETADRIPEILSEIIDRADAILPELLTLAGTVIPQLADSLLPQIIGMVNAVIGDLLELIPALIRTMLPALVSGTSQLLMSLVRQLPALLAALAASLRTILKELGAAIPQMIGEAASDLLPALVALVADNLPEIIDAVLAILEGSVPQILFAAEQLIGALIAAFPVLLRTVLGSAAEIVSRVTALLRDSIPAILQLLTDAVPELVSVLSEALPEIIAVCSGMLSELLPELIALAAQILTDGIPVLLQAATDLLLSIADAVPQLLTALAALLPQVIAALIAAVPTVTAAICAALPSIITAVISTLRSMIPQLVQCGVTLLTSLVQALPVIIQAICAALPQIISAVISALTDLIPLLISCGIELFTSLIAALPQIITAIADAMPLIITSIVSALTNPGMLRQIIDCGIRLFTSLIEALPQIIAAIVRAVPQIISAIAGGFREGFGQIRDVGRQLIEGLWNGISDMVLWIRDKITSFGADILGGLKDFFGIHSPSTVFRDQIGRNLVRGLADGIDAEADTAVGAMQQMAADLADVDFPQRQIDFADFGSNYPDDTDPTALERSITSQFGGNIVQTVIFDPALLSRLDSILDAVERGQVLVLDGDAVVGGTADRMNEALGEMEALAERGVR
jgi:phage-related protein